jgi:hypothetical protein
MFYIMIRTAGKQSSNKAARSDRGVLVASLSMPQVRERTNLMDPVIQLHREL